MADEIEVVIATCNRPGTLPDAIESVLQSRLIGSAQQIIVVDDGAGDAEPTALRYGVRYARSHCGSPAGTRNVGLTMVSAPFVAFLDDDDVWLDGNLERQMAAMGENSRLAFSFAQSQLTDVSLTSLGMVMPIEKVSKQLPGEFFFVTDIQLATVLFRSKTLQQASGFDETFRYCEDTELYVRLSETNLFSQFEGVGALFRQRPIAEDDAHMRWRSYLDRQRIFTKLRRRGEFSNFSQRFHVQRHLRGLTVDAICRAAAIPPTSGRPTQKRRHFVRAVRISPLHAARHWRLLLP